MSTTPRTDALQSELKQWKACADKLARCLRSSNETLGWANAEYANLGSGVMENEVSRNADDLREYEELKKGGA